MSEIKSLAKETAIYGVSSILGKFLNWLLVPMYTFVLHETSDYGVISNLYAWSALLLVILTYGMETGFFRFVNKFSDRANTVYSTTLCSIGFTSLVFALLAYVFAQPVANFLGYSQYPEFISLMAVILAMDAFGGIPFAYLRYERKSLKFAMLKLLMIVVNIGSNIFFLIVCPWIMKHQPALVDWFYNPDYGVGYVFVSNLISTSVVTLALLPEVLKTKFSFDSALLKQMLRYSLPLLLLGIAGVMDQAIDKILFPMLIDDLEFAQSELGIYGACFKIAMVMMMFTQAFRYAYEPFVFAKHKDKNSLPAYADAMKYFIIFSFLILLGMIFYLDILKLIISQHYWEGMRVVPIVLFSYLFQGVFFNLSLWYKLTDKTRYGAYFSWMGLAITLALNMIFVPIYSYMACAWASFVCYFVMMVVSYFIGQKHMPIPYDFKSIGIYTGVTLLLLGLNYFIETPYAYLDYALRTVLLLAFVSLVVKRDFPLKNLPVVGKYFK